MKKFIPCIIGFLVVLGLITTAQPTQSQGGGSNIPMGEVGYLNNNLTHSSKTVMLNHSYTNPVVFILPPSQEGSDTAVVRITDIQADRFTVYVHEAPNRDGTHTSEAVSYMVLEAGVWWLPDGTKLQVGLTSTDATVGNRVNNRWQHVDFAHAFSTAPIVISQVQSNDDPHWVKTRQGVMPLLFRSP